jgi:hypothetical protein
LRLNDFKAKGWFEGDFLRLGYGSAACGGDHRPTRFRIQSVFFALIRGQK